MKTLTYYYRLQDERGNSSSGVTVVCFPAGSGSHGTTASDEGDGVYKFVIDPTSDNLVISRFYDVYVDGTLHQEDVDLGQWEWYCENVEVDGEQTFNYADLLDENSEALPTTIEELHIAPTSKNNKQAKFDWNTTSVTITLDSDGDDPEGKFDLWLRVKK